ncbi:CBN-UBXN-3 protein [Caenorhabditis brenneri]|uniref:CBN-UBXN-3 protein n=1 Tax=Caenorhabditis brenneri TaxID=135651 RepID=G0N4S4_CAEBE|nr:CBN-UBXN-3 protein [Caenorhabditis brenneri]
MDHLGLEDDQKEKLRQYTEFTHQHDYEVAVGTLASLNWNLEQAIEAHLMQEDMNDDDDPEILEAIPPRPAANDQSRISATALSNGRRVEPEIIDIEAQEMPATRGRRRGRAPVQDETTMVDNQVKRLRIDDDNQDSKTSKRGEPVPRQAKRGQAAGTSASSSSAHPSASSAPPRRHTRANPAPPEPAQPVPARQNGTSSSRPQNQQRAPMGHHNQHAARTAPPPVIAVDDSDDDDDMNIVYDDEDEIEHHDLRNGPVSNNEVAPRGVAVTNGRVPMIPDGYSSVPDALRNFVTVFSDRFCSTPATQAFMPPFYTDTLQNALKEAFENPNSELRRPLVFYINHDRSIAANIFASQVLCSETVSSLIRHQYILFPWDISSDANLMHFMEFLQATNMADVRNMIQRVAMNKVEAFPMMIIVTRERNTYRLVDICKGTDTADQVMEKLLAGVEEYSNIRMKEVSEQRERYEREAIRNQQEAEYKASLAADKARMEAKQREIEEQRMEEERKQKELEDEETRRQIVASTLPEEPPANAPTTEIINVKFRLPEGGQDMRRFRRTESIQTLIDYLSSKGFSPDKYKYFNSDFPKKEITRNFDLSTNFTDAKWPAREQIFVEEI